MIREEEHEIEGGGGGEGGEGIGQWVKHVIGIKKQAYGERMGGREERMGRIVKVVAMETKIRGKRGERGKITIIMACFEVRSDRM